MQTDFTPNSLEQNTQILANYMPNGLVFFAKNVGDSNLRKLLIGLAGEFTREQNKVYELSTEYNLEQTTNLLDEWESALGIPDECFSKDATVSISQRRQQIIAKFAMMNLLVEQDWIKLASFFGYDISITYGTIANVFPMTFPIILIGGAKQARFTMIIKFKNLNTPSNVFDMKFPITFEANANLMVCLFSHLKPANVSIIYRYADQ